MPYSRPTKQRLINGSPPFAKRKPSQRPTTLSPAWERWDQAGFKEQDAQEKAKAAKEAYKAGLRQRDYGF
jgi:hypothetical protein